MSEDMFQTLKRLYYVTPTNYIELVKGYVDMLEAKQKEYGNEITKLRLGLHKLDEAGESSETLKQQLQISQIQLQKSQKEVEDLMIKIEGESRDVNEK
jgi:dynein heavy chain, axonemal